MPIYSFKDFVSATRGSAVVKASALSSEGREITFNRETPSLPQEGITSIHTGFHLYAMVLLRPELAASSLKEDRKKNISVLADLTNGVREVAHSLDGLLLEAQGPVAHAFIPTESATPEDIREAAIAIQAHVDKRIRPRVGDSLLRSLVAYSHGPTIFTCSEDAQGDNSIVSLARAANAPAKVLWRGWKELRDGAILEVDHDGNAVPLREDKAAELIKKAERSTIFNSARMLGDVALVEAKTLSVPPPGSPDSPTVEEPHESFSVSIRADMDGFTSSVEKAYAAGTDAIEALATKFLGIMAHARKFCREQCCVHLPWAGDCFNLLLSFSSRDDYFEAKRRKILEVTSEFQQHMAAKFPDIGWAFSCAGGSLENAQCCNTLVSRLSIGHSTLLLATGLPVERSLQGLIRESPKAKHGVLWKGDVEGLDVDLGDILETPSGGHNSRHFSVSAIEGAMEKRDFHPAPAPYISKTVAPKIAAAVGSVRPYFHA